MATVQVRNQKGEAAGELELPAAAFGAEVKRHILHEVVVNQLANRRAGTHKTKTRAQVAGGGAKPWRQKGTGRARAGSNTSPIWVRGGSAHGPKPRDYSYRVPSKVRRQALAMALSHKAEEGKVHVIEDLALETPKTREFVAALKALGVDKALVVVAEASANLEFAARNVAGSDVIRVEGLNVYDILRHDNLVVTQAAMDKISERVAKK